MNGSPPNRLPFPPGSQVVPSAHPPIASSPIGSSAPADRHGIDADRARAFVNDSVAAHFAASPEGTLLACNPACVAMLGAASAEDVVGAPLSRYFNRDEDFDDVISAIRAQRRLDDHHFEMRAADGRPIYLIGNLSGRFDEHGELTEISASLHDVTGHKKLEQQLRQSLKMESIGRLAGGIAHDFNNLLTVMINQAERLLETVRIGEPEHRAAETIRKSAERAASLTQQLLAFSRKQIRAPRLMDLNRVVSNMHALLCRLIGEDIRLTVVPDPNLAPVKADRNQIEQVIMNLVVNARDALPGGGEVRIMTTNEYLDEAAAAKLRPMAPGHYVLLTVADDGHGMDAEMRAHIFEPFFTTKEMGKGTGLGLSTVYGIVKQSEGYVWVDSEPGRGATFRIYLPRAEGVVTSAGVEPEIRRHVEKVTGTILLVEDEEDVRELLREILEGRGYTVLEVEDGAAALALSRRHDGPIDLLVTDVVMPQMSGRELALELAEHRPATKVLYLSGYTNDAVVSRGVLEASSAFLQKPFTARALADKVAELLAVTT
jgi:PAS domain S-box-containing protein